MIASKRVNWPLTVTPISLMLNSMRLFAAIRGRGAAATAPANNSSAAATIRADTSITKLLVLFWARQTRQHPPQDGIAIDELVFERSQQIGRASCRERGCQYV